MSKITLGQLANLNNPTTATTLINANSTTVQTAIDNTLSRDGTSPNQMGASLDMNSNRVLNLPKPIASTEPVRLLDLAAAAIAPTKLSSFVFLMDTADQVISGGANVASLLLPTGNVTLDCGLRPFQYIVNNGAFTITAPVNDGSMTLLLTNAATAGPIAFTGFSVGANTGDVLTLTNGSKFMLSVIRINSTSTYSIKALQ